MDTVSSTHARTHSTHRAVLPSAIPTCHRYAHTLRKRNVPSMQGETGPLVYPAAFVYIYSGLRVMTDDGINIKRAQVIYAGVYAPPGDPRSRMPVRTLPPCVCTPAVLTAICLLLPWYSSRTGLRLG